MIRRRIDQFLDAWSTPVDEQNPSARDLLIAFAVLLLLIVVAYVGPIVLYAMRP